MASANACTRGILCGCGEHRADQKYENPGRSSQGRKCKRRTSALERNSLWIGAETRGLAFRRVHPLPYSLADLIWTATQALSRTPEMISGKKARAKGLHLELKMNRPNDISNAVPLGEADPKGTGPEALEARLAHAAEMAVQDGVSVEVFSQLAFDAYAMKNPEFREQLEMAQLRNHFEVLRAHGRMGIA